MDFFGLDIGSGNLKLVQLKKTGEKFNIVALGLAPVEKSLESESEADLAVVAETIRKLVGVAKVTTKDVVCSLPEDKIFTRIVEFPRMDEKELKSAIKWEAEQYIPIPLSEVVVDYQFLSEFVEEGKKKKIRVFLAAAPKNLVDKYLSVLEMADLRPVGLETEMVALARSLILPGSAPTIVVDLGSRATDIGLIENGEVILTRSIPSAGKAITRSLATNLDMKPEQAEAYKKAYGIDKEKLEGKIMKAAGPVIDLVIGEVKKVISSQKEKEGALRIERVILSGGTADLPQIIHLFAERLGVEVEIGDPFQRAENASEVLLKLEKGAMPLFAVAFGLAMKDF